MTWEEHFSTLPLDTQMWMLLGTKRYMNWVLWDKPAYPRFIQIEAEFRKLVGHTPIQ